MKVLILQLTLIQTTVRPEFERKTMKVDTVSRLEHATLSNKFLAARIYASSVVSRQPDCRVCTWCRRASDGVP